MSVIAHIQTDSQASPTCFKSWVKRPTLLVGPRKEPSCRINWRRIWLWRIQFTGGTDSVRNRLCRKHLTAHKLSCRWQKCACFQRRPLPGLQESRFLESSRPHREMLLRKEQQGQPREPGSSKGPHRTTWDHPPYGITSPCLGTSPRWDQPADPRGHK